MKVTIFLVLGMLLMLSLNAEVKAYCETDGCSAWNIVPFKNFFKPACDKHDVCYACGDSNGWSRGQCDRAFLSDMGRLCQTLRNGFARVKCHKYTAIYYGAVRAFGWLHYEEPSLKWCASCPRYKGNPYSALGR